MGGNLNTVPASVIASWPKPNYIDPPTRSWLPAYAGTLQAVATLMVVTRIWLRATKKAGAVGLDDAFLVPAWLGATMFTTLAMINTLHYGSDRHTWDVEPSKFEGLVLITWCSEFAYLISTCSTKISVLLFYRRLVNVTFSKRWKYAIIVSIFFTAAYGIAFILVLVFNCSPTQAYWKAYDPTYHIDYHCTDTQVLNTLSGVVSVISDVYSVLLPCLMLRHFDAPRRQKMALYGIFLFGLLVVAAGAVRTYYLVELGRAYDLTWTGFNVIVWAQLEIQLALIGACAPSLRVFFRHYLSTPFTRAVQSARTASANKSRRDSRQTDCGPIVSRSNSRATLHTPDIHPAHRLQAKPSLNTVEEMEYSHSIAPSYQSSDIRIVTTPEEYEAFNLQTIKKAQSFSRPVYPRADSDSIPQQQWPLPKR